MRFQLRTRRRLAAATAPTPIPHQSHLTLRLSKTGAFAIAPICLSSLAFIADGGSIGASERGKKVRSEEHTSELQSRPHLVCRLLLEKTYSKYRSICRRTNA